MRKESKEKRQQLMQFFSPLLNFSLALKNALAKSFSPFEACEFFSST
jgi:hypothetical protein